MDRVFKHLLLWFLMAALPVQGMAAIIKANCGPRHHTSFSVGKAAPEGTMVQEHVPDAHLNHAGVQSTSDWTEPKATSVEKSGSSSDVLPDHTASYCSACAACCTGAVAPPVALAVVPFPDSAGGTIVSPSDSYLGFIPAGLDRPPKSFSS
jgi:hypothetical protein